MPLQMKLLCFLCVAKMNFVDADLICLVTAQMCSVIHYTEVAKHLNITYDVRDAENVGGIAECSHIMEFTVLREMSWNLSKFG